ncbi:MAG TPA: hypothetical protein PK664_05685 [Paludibacteraceae bacterium]|mgnify:CR=1 FL=1|nr:hypothetical protein [Bacteroidales bacterium]HPS10845.1 hypothetical protein [Paludibacteraceae bacterium]
MRTTHNIAVCVYGLFLIFLKDYIPDYLKEGSSILFAILGLLLIIGNLFFLFYDYDAKEVKSFEKIASTQNGGNYLEVCFLIFITDTDPIHPFGTIVFLTITIFLLMFCFWAILRDMIIKKVFISLVIVAHLIFGYFMFSKSKWSFTRYYGNEIIGSFWAKSDYRTIYLVKLYKGDSNKFYPLPALLHVYSEDNEDDFGYGYQMWTEKNVSVEYVFFSNGGYLIFDDCNLYPNNKEYCIDQNGSSWYIELTEKKLNISKSN